MWIDEGVRIGVEKPVRWYVEAKGKRYDLCEVRDFFRVWLLLERPYPEVKSELDALAKEAGATDTFPMWKVVACAFLSKTANNAEDAVTWLPFMEPGELALFSDLLGEVRDAKWARQRTRQMARKFKKKADMGRQTNAS